MAKGLVPEVSCEVQRRAYWLALLTVAGKVWGRKPSMAGGGGGMFELENGRY